MVYSDGWDDMIGRGMAEASRKWKKSTHRKKDREKRGLPQEITISKTEEEMAKDLGVSIDKVRVISRWGRSQNIRGKRYAIGFACPSCSKNYYELGPRCDVCDGRGWCWDK